MRIGLSYDLKEDVLAEQAASNDASEEYDSKETVNLIADSIAAGGHEVVMLGGGREFLNNILSQHVDFVFNIAEGRGSYRNREAQVPAILEMLGIPYSGSDPQCMSICLNKPLAKKLVAAAGVPTPKWHVISNEKDIINLIGDDLSFPLIIKLAYEGSSKGINAASLAQNPEQATLEAKRLLDVYHQPVIMEEFIEGDEVTVGILGNSPAKILGSMRILPNKKEGHFIYSLEVKRDYLNQVTYEYPVCLKPEVLTNLEKLALTIFKTLDCRDFSRIDFRINRNGTPCFIEINPLPGLGNHSDLVIISQKKGWTHQKLVSTVLQTALERYPQCVRA